MFTIQCLGARGRGRGFNSEPFVSIYNRIYEFDKEGRSEFRQKALSAAFAVAGYKHHHPPIIHIMEHHLLL